MQTEEVKLKQRVRYIGTAEVDGRVIVPRRGDTGIVRQIEDGLAYISLDLRPWRKSLTEVRLKDIEPLNALEELALIDDKRLLEAQERHESYKRAKAQRPTR